jgi:hypothetical protein
MGLFSDTNKKHPYKTQKTPQKTRKTINTKKSKNKTKYTVTFAMIIHGCIITTDLNHNYNIDLYNATGDNIDICEKTIWEFNDEHERLLKYFRKNNPTPEKKYFFDKMPYDKFIGKTSNDLYAGVWLLSVHDNNNQLVFPRDNDSLETRFNLFNLNLLNRLFLDFNRDKISYTELNYEKIYNTEYNVQDHSGMKDFFLNEHKPPPEKNNEEYRDFSNWNVSVNDPENPTHIDKIRLSYFLDRLKYIFGDNVNFRAYDYTCTVPCNNADDIQINLPLKYYGGKKNKKKNKNKTKKKNKRRLFNLRNI